jgi:hypothetical protein
VDEGTEKVLDVFQEAAVNTIFLATFTYGRGSRFTVVRSLQFAVRGSRPRFAVRGSPFAVRRSPAQDFRLRAKRFGGPP